MIKIKDGVWFHSDTFKEPEMCRAFQVFQDTAPKGYDPTITSAGDGKHKHGSKHYIGMGDDWRIRDYPKNQKVEDWVNRIQKRLGDKHFVLLEKDHIHHQYNG
jgi:hypothetical protein